MQSETYQIKVTAVSSRVFSHCVIFQTNQKDSLLKSKQDPWRELFREGSVALLGRVIPKTEGTSQGTLQPAA